MQPRLRHSFGRRGLRLLLAATVILAGAAAVAVGAALEPAARAGGGYVYNTPGTISGLASNGTRVAAFVSARGNKLVVLWRPGQAALTAPAAPPGSHHADLRFLHFEDANVVWTDRNTFQDAAWDGRGKVRWRDNQDTWRPSAKVNVACVHGGCVENRGHSLVFVAKPARYVFNSRGEIYSFASDGNRVAALIFIQRRGVRTVSIVLWRPGETPLTAARAAPPNFFRDAKDALSAGVGWLHFDGVNVAWSAVACGMDCYETDAVWDGRGDIHWSSIGNIGHLGDTDEPKPQPELKVAGVQGGRVQTCGNGLFFIPDQ